MDQFNQQQNNPSMSDMGGNPVGEHKSSIGPIVGSIIVVLMIVLGGLYLYGSQLNNRGANESAEEILNAPDAAAAALQNQGATDAISEIEADLKATNLDNLDAEAANLEKELSI